MKFVDFVRENQLGDVVFHQKFKELTTIGCGGEIRVCYYPKDVESLKKVFVYLIKNELRYFVIGNGSNVLAQDDFYDGVVIVLKKMPYDYTLEGNILSVSAFYPTSKLAYDLAKEEIGDLSFLGGIPGLMGGAVYNNSGAYQEDISRHLTEVTYLSSSGTIETISQKDCHFGYRRSVFHGLNAIILSAKFQVCHKSTLDLLEQRKKKRMLTQPLESKSMGSVFKNNALISAWKVVDALGLRGFEIGGAAVSCKHSNFIINLNDATSSEIETLIDLIQKRAELEFGIRLVCEITRV